MTVWPKPGSFYLPPRLIGLVASLSSPSQFVRLWHAISARPTLSMDSRQVVVQTPAPPPPPTPQRGMNTNICSICDTNSLFSALFRVRGGLWTWNKIRRWGSLHLQSIHLGGGTPETFSELYDPNPFAISRVSRSTPMQDSNIQIPSEKSPRVCVGDFR